MTFDTQRPFRSNLREVFIKSFTVMDIAEPLVSFDAEQPSAEVLTAMEAYDFDVVGVRRNGKVAGYVRRDFLEGGPCGGSMKNFSASEAVMDTTPLLKVIEPLSRGATLFVSILYSIGAVITPWDLQKPAVRMVAFGVVTMVEMKMVLMIRAAFPEESWKPLLSDKRIEKAAFLLNERLRRKEQSDLLECLQFDDKSDLLAKNPDLRQALGFTSKNQAQKAFSDLGRLRDNLAHGQYLQPQHLETVARLTSVLDHSLNALDPFGDNLNVNLHHPEQAR